MCKKGESAVSKLESTADSADSAISVASEKLNNVSDQASAALDSANVKIKDFENAKNEVKDKIENTSKIVDSLSEKISSVKLETKKDSAKKEEKIIVNVPAPKVIKETKIVYKDQPKNENYELNVPKNKLVKTGVLELTVDDAETAKEIVKEEVSKYDGFVRSENISLNNDEKKIAYLKVKVPIQKFDDLMEDLSYNLGKVENKSIELSGQDFVQNTMCEVDVTLYGKTGDYSENKEPKTFGEKSFTAISSGWEVIMSIVLFILPLWPLFLILGIGYYFYKRRGKNTTNNDSN
ncbi:hypothetical protein GCM10022217_30510 [Chryseobacterium ginsenosidimutans]